MSAQNLSARVGPTRTRLTRTLADAAAQWGADVPEDPGVGELADLLSEAARALPAGTPGHGVASARLALALRHLRAADRLGGLLPVVTCGHLHRAVRYERAARDALDRTG
ncbi:hypothetical protein ACIRP0_07380 [Streptomyces sp. NPDC101733]|uniref:hypothetical protein n=1 Tax=unclassified Streptomyces TaxID=2593676 RepID=UPI00380D8E06